MNQGNPPPNWYPDPKGEAELRYWDGTQWTDHTHSGQAAAAPAPATLGPQTAPAPQAPPPAAASAPPAQAGYQQPPTQAEYQQPPTYQQPGPAGPGPGGAPSGGGGSKVPLIIGGVVALLALVAIGLFAGGVIGGGDDAPSEEDKVTEAAEEVITTTEPSACEELATREFVQKLTGESGAEAISACEENTEAFGDSAEIEEPEITGDKATVEAAVEGGDADGETLEMEFVKQGDDWKIDELARTEQLEGSKATQAATNTVLNFGSSEGPTACRYLSYSGLQRLDGKAGCEKEFKEATAANYSAEDVSVSDKTATVTVTESRQNKTINFKLVHEAGNWKIESFSQE
jgi:hypothetical protein